MTMHATLYWSLCLVAATALVGGRHMVSAAAPRQATAQPADTSLEQAVRSAIQAQILSKGVPGVSVAVMRDGKMLMEGAWGRADVDRNLGMHHSQLLGAGGICTTAADLVKWRHALHRGLVLSANSYAGMTTPRGPAVSGNYGFGLYARPAPWGDMAIVGGGQALSGHTAELHWYPGRSLAVALLYNAAPRVPGVADLVPRIVLGVPLPEKSK